MDRKYKKITQAFHQQLNALIDQYEDGDAKAILKNEPNKQGFF